VPDSLLRQSGIFAAALLCGVAAGLFGVGGGVLLVPLLVLLFGFSQHRAQGTSLIALVPPTGLLAFLAYSKEGYVSWRVGLELLPGMFVGSIFGVCARHLRGCCSSSAPGKRLRRGGADRP